MDPSKFLENLGVDVEAMGKKEKLLSSRRRRNPYICLCGHPVSRHTVTEQGNVICKPSKMWCHCTRIFNVLATNDTRFFFKMSNGSFQEHALFRGIYSLVPHEGKTVEWVTANIACFECKKKSENLIPAIIEYMPDGSEAMLENRKSEKKDKYEYHRDLADILLCPRCYKKKGGMRSGK
jgi:hypothetical protein